MSLDVSAADVVTARSAHSNVAQQVDLLTKELHAVRLAGEQKMAVALDAKGVAEKELQRVLGAAGDGAAQLGIAKKEMQRYRKSLRVYLSMTDVLIIADWRRRIANYIK